MVSQTLHSETLWWAKLCIVQNCGEPNSALCNTVVSQLCIVQHCDELNYAYCYTVVSQLCIVKHGGEPNSAQCNTVVSQTLHCATLCLSQLCIVIHGGEPNSALCNTMASQTLHSETLCYFFLEKKCVSQKVGMTSKQLQYAFIAGLWIRSLVLQANHLFLWGTGANCSSRS